MTLASTGTGTVTAVPPPAGAHRQPATGGLDLDALRVQPDVPLGDPAGDVRRSAPTPSSATRSSAMPARRERHRELLRLRMFDDVGQQLARRAVQQRLHRRAQPRGPPRRVEIQAKPTSLRCRRCQPAERGGESRLLQHRGMQLGHLRAQLPRGLGERLFHPVERRGVAGIAGVLEIEARGEDVLQRAVVQVLGEGAMFPLGDGHQLPGQARSVASQTGDGRHPRPLDRRTDRPPPRRRPASTSVRSQIDAQGSSFASRVRMASIVNSTTVGTTTPTLTHHRSCVAASTGIRKNPSWRTSAVHDSTADSSAISDRAVRAARSTYSPDHP